MNSFTNIISTFKTRRPGLKRSPRSNEQPIQKGQLPVTRWQYLVQARPEDLNAK